MEVLALATTGLALFITGVFGETVLSNYEIVGSDWTADDFAVAIHHFDRLSLIECGLKCNVEDDCLSFVFKSQAGVSTTCDIYDEVPTALVTLGVGHILNSALYKRTGAGAWKLIFYVQAGSGINVYDAWSTGNPSPCSSTESMLYCKDSVIDDNWASVKQVTYKIRSNSSSTYATFDVISPDKTCWLDRLNVIDSPYTDMDTHNRFSLNGHTAYRRFQMFRTGNGCAGDYAWAVVSDVYSGSRWCAWDEVGPFPAFRFCPPPTACLADSESVFGNELLIIAMV